MDGFAAVRCAGGGVGRVSFRDSGARSHDGACVREVVGETRYGRNAAAQESKTGKGLEFVLASHFALLFIPLLTNPEILVCAAALKSWRPIHLLLCGKLVAIMNARHALQFLKAAAQLAQRIGKGC